MKHAYAGEVLFKRYADTSTQGQTVTFTLPGRAELESFIGLEGKRFQAVFVQIGDDELPAEPEGRAKGGHARAEALSPERRTEIAKDAAAARWKKPDPAEPKERARLSPLCEWAVMRCKEPEFRHWLSIAALKTVPALKAVPDDIAAKGAILRYCGIESRRELDTNPEAARIFKEKIMTPYREYLERQNPIHEPETTT